MKKNIDRIEDIKDCFDGSFMKKIFLNIKLSKEFIEYLKNDSIVEYFPDFAIPFFRATKNGFYIMKGVLDDIEIELILYRSNIKDAQIHITKFINSF